MPTLNLSYFLLLYDISKLFLLSLSLSFFYYYVIILFYIVIETTNLLFSIQIYMKIMQQIESRRSGTIQNVYNISQIFHATAPSLIYIHYFIHLFIYFLVAFFNGKEKYFFLLTRDFTTKIKEKVKRTKMRRRKFFLIQTN